MLWFRFWTVALLVGCSYASAEEADDAMDAPSMEAGVGLVSQFSADYRGSNYYSLEALPVPYFLYSGRIIKVDRQGFRGELVANPRFEVNVSVAGSLNGSADDNPLRQGMPDLESTFEVGPSLNINLTGQDFRHGWLLRLPLRAVLDFDAKGVDYVGYLFNPRLTWRKPDVVMAWRMTFNAGLVWADRDYHAYYYAVEPAYALPSRPAFAARSGFGGGFASLGFYRQSGSWRFGASLRYDYLGGAAFIDSPLVQSKHSASMSFGMTKRLWLRD